MAQGSRSRPIAVGEKRGLVPLDGYREEPITPTIGANATQGHIAERGARAGVRRNKVPVSQRGNTRRPDLGRSVRPDGD